MTWTALRWIWRIATNAFYLLVVWYVLSRLRGRTENIIVPVLGLVYVTIRTMAYGNVYLAARFGLVLDDINNKLNKLAYPQYERDTEAFVEAKETMQTNQWLSYVDLTGFGLISLLCLWHILVTI